MDSITFDTYPPMFKVYEEYLENEEYDEQIRLFSVPKAWAVDWIFIQFRMGLEDFMNEYTWDDTFEMYGAAKAAGVILSDEIVDRG